MRFFIKVTNVWFLTRVENLAIFVVRVFNLGYQEEIILGRRRFNQADLATFEQNSEEQIKRARGFNMSYKFSHVVRAVSEITEDGMAVVCGKAPAGNYTQAEEIYERFLLSHPDSNIQILDTEGNVVKELIS